MSALPSSLSVPLAGPVDVAAQASASDPPVAEVRTGRRMRWLALGIMAWAVVLSWVGVWQFVSASREAAIGAERRQTENLAAALQEQAERVLATSDHAARRVAEAVAAGDVDPDLVRIANETGLVPKILVQLSLIGTDGRFQSSNVDPGARKAGPVDLSDREHVRAHLRPRSGDRYLMAGDGLFIGKPVFGKVSGRWTVQLSRAITASDGRVLGVVVASLDPAHFASVFSRVSIGPRGTVMLAGQDGVVRAMHGNPDGRDAGRADPGGGPAPAAAEKERPTGLGTQLPDGVVPARSAANRGGSTVQDGVAGGRVVAHQQLSGYPLTVLVSTAMADEALVDWQRNRNAILLLTALLSASLMAGSFVYVNALARLEKSNARLRVSEAAARSAAEAKTAFLVAMSHELRTPLTSIHGYAELMERRIEQPAFREYAQMIRTGADRLHALLTSILDLCELEGRRLPVEEKSQDLRMLLAAACAPFGSAASAKGLQLDIYVAPDVPQQLVCDGGRLQQVVSQLLSNAVKFTAEGRVDIAVTAIPPSPSHARGAVQVQVTDTGPGVPPDQRDAIFEAFRQGNEKVSYEHGGTGVGLALARGLAERMGGTLVLDPSYGPGARFTLIVPQRAVAVAAGVA